MSQRITHANNDLRLFLDIFGEIKNVIVNRADGKIVCMLAQFRQQCTEIYSND